MSKWGLLFRKKGTRKDESSVSIHRHSGFEVIPKSKLIWPGYKLQLEWSFDLSAASSEDSRCLFDELYRSWLDHMMLVDCGELHIDISFPGITSTNMVRELIDSHPDSALMYIARKTVARATADADADTDTDALPLAKLELVVSHKSLVPFLSSCKFWSYKVPVALVAATTSSDPSTVLNDFKVLTRETGEAAPNTRQLTAHVTYGVDNTGNVRVWQAESVLLYHLLKSRRSYLKQKRVLEIGAGMTGLCGVALALLGAQEAEGGKGNWGPCEVIISDGNPECVSNQRVCWEMNRQEHRDALAVTGTRVVLPVSFRTLRWMRNDPHGEIQNILHNCASNIEAAHPSTVFPRATKLSTSSPVDVIIGADCLFFKEFHEDLLYTLYALLGCGCIDSSSGSSMGRVVYLLQPRRGGTMELFLSCLRSNPQYNGTFKVDVVEDFDEEITALHCQYMMTRQEQIERGEAPTYDPDVHLPVLIVLTCIRQSPVWPILTQMELRQKNINYNQNSYITVQYTHLALLPITVLFHFSLYRKTCLQSPQDQA